MNPLDEVSMIDNILKHNTGLSFDKGDISKILDYEILSVLKSHQILFFYQNLENIKELEQLTLEYEQK